jgi:gluconate 2-dehydrogenase gamma chain
MSENDIPKGPVGQGPTRREALGVMAGAAAGTGIDWSSFGVNDLARARASQHAKNSRANVAKGQVYEPGFFEPGEWTALRIVVDLIIPADERSGSATDAGVPEYIDYLMLEGDDAQRVAVRGGFAWLDREFRKRFDASFVGTTDANREAVLSDIAWPERAPVDLSHGVEFFNRMRDLTASGFWSSRLGVDDLEYTGNTMIPAWDGCPDEQLERLGVQRPRSGDSNESGTQEPDTKEAE